jgi:hypothetical protein
VGGGGGGGVGVGVAVGSGVGGWVATGVGEALGVVAAAEPPHATIRTPKVRARAAAWKVVGRMMFLVVLR